MESGWFLAIIGALLVLSLLAGRWVPPDHGPLAAALAGLGLGLGAVQFAGIMAGGGHPVVIGIVAGLACASLAQASTRGVLGRAAGRLDAAARAALPLYAEAAGLVVAGLSVLVPPVSLLVLSALGWLGLQGRRRGDARYAGLRVLR